MKSREQQGRKQRDDSLYGLLSAYKANSCYVRVLESKDGEELVVQIADNPKRFFEASAERYREYRVLSRLDLGVEKMSLKYLNVENIVAVMGPLLDLSIPPESATIIDSMYSDGIYSIVTTRRYRNKVIHGVRKLLNMSSQKRYELLEKYFSGSRESRDG